jgi:hypothetical protein
MVCCDVGTPYLWRCSRSIKRLVVSRVCSSGVCDPAQLLSKVLLFLEYVQQEYNRRDMYRVVVVGVRRG